jgi:flagellar hook-basal body complex protein FliE
MAAPIGPITAPALAQVTAQVAAPAPIQAPAGAAGFASMLNDAVTRMDQSNKASQGAVDRFLSGENEEIHDMVMATQRNELQFELFQQVRNKIVLAYQEVMRMQM